MNKFLFLVAAAAMLTACQAVQPGPVALGVAGFLGAVDQLLAGGVIDPLQHSQLVGGIQAVEQSVQVVQKAQEGSASPELVYGAAGSAVATAVGLIQAWRGRASKGLGAVINKPKAA